MTDTLTPKNRKGGDTRAAARANGKKVGRNRIPADRRKRPMTLRIDPALHAWLKTLPRGETERILSRAHAESLIV